jgi:hypothetical protein
MARKKAVPAKEYAVEDSFIAADGGISEIATTEPTGTASGASAASATTSSARVTGPISGWYTGGGVVTPAWTSTTTGVYKTPKPAKVVDVPSKRPKKILIAFLDEDDNTEWSAKLHAGTINVEYGETGVPEMSLHMHLTEAD